MNVVFDWRQLVAFVLYWAIFTWQLGIDRRRMRLQRRVDEQGERIMRLEEKVGWLQRQVDGQQQGPYREVGR